MYEAFVHETCERQSIQRGRKSFLAGKKDADLKHGQHLLNLAITDEATDWPSEEACLQVTIVDCLLAHLVQRSQQVIGRNMPGLSSIMFATLSLAVHIVINILSDNVSKF
eukprot:TRINITY_DN28928_c0_g1_i2.p2 TRINITY_DN28928_c0_g1~~TRINITY_DN28928_c0_g1_i2.p2  ORF type:complete len:110 (+),score=11.44 TRINITY_DN28928_c0_g1_i2:273-602(+)